MIFFYTKVSEVVITHSLAFQLCVKKAVVSLRLRGRLSACACSNTKAGPWSAEEIEQLIVAMEHVPYGKWAKVQSEYHFGHRSQVWADPGSARFARLAALPCIKFCQPILAVQLHTK